MPDCEIHTTDPEAVAWSIDFAIAYEEIDIVIACKTVIARAKITIGNRKSGTIASIQPVVATPDIHFAYFPVRAMSAIDSPVCRIFNGETFEWNVPAIDKPLIYSVSQCLCLPGSYKV